jgi:hypothetical protein
MDFIHLCLVRTRLSCGALDKAGAFSDTCKASNLIEAGAASPITKARVTDRFIGVI